MKSTFWNLLITHVHIEASMGSARAKVTEVIAEWFSLRIRPYRSGSLRNGRSEQGRRSAPGKMKPVRTFY
jgi:hypothetical protein